MALHGAVQPPRVGRIVVGRVALPPRHVSFHRTAFRRGRKEQLVSFADRALLVGLALLLVGITSAVLLVLDVVLGRWPAVAGGSAVGPVWYC